MEEWKVIEFATNYEVSNHGRIRNRRTKYVLKPITKSSHKQPQIFLQSSSIWGKAQHTISQIVYNHWCRRDGERPSYYESNGYMVKGNRIGHRDGNIMNNHPNNLYRY